MALKEALVVPTEELVRREFVPPSLEDYVYTPLSDEGFTKFIELAQEHGHVRQRGGDNDVEQDETVQQIILYGIVLRDDGSFLIYQRGAQGKGYNEDRLAGKVALGIGGHMESNDTSLLDAFYREFGEETTLSINGIFVDFSHSEGGIDIDKVKSHIIVTPVGLLKDARDSVGRVHIGVVCRVTTVHMGAHIGINTEDGENVNYKYITIKEYLELVGKSQIDPEGWTDIVFQHEINRDT